MMTISRRSLLKGAIVTALSTTMIGRAIGAIYFNVIVGRPTATSATISLMADAKLFVYLEYGYSKTAIAGKTALIELASNIPHEVELQNLKSNAKIFYRIRYRATSSGTFATGKQYSFQTQRNKGGAFTFTVQGDTHPERAGKMFNAELYSVAMANVLAQNPDFHILLGDDFSIDPLISKGAATLENVEKIYRTHRQWLALSGTPIFLVNGNHEQAAQYLLDGTESNPAINAGKSRIKYFPLPTPNGFYTGDQAEIEFLGNPRDYFAWHWGDALFITLDPYWHSKYAVDNVAGVSNEQDQQNKKNGAGASKSKDLWQVGIGDEQYLWLKKTLETSTAKYIFVFAHHVMGTGRGAVEVSYNYEWGGKDPQGVTTFAQQRPTWELPIHDLLVKHKVSIFFQGHDHIFVTQERDGLIYQSMPNPADDTFSLFNDTAYKSGVKAPNSGHVRVSVTPTAAKVDYFLAARKVDTKRKNLSIAHSYSVKPRVI